MEATGFMISTALVSPDSSLLVHRRDTDIILTRWLVNQDSINKTEATLDGPRKKIEVYTTVLEHCKIALVILHFWYSHPHTVSFP